MANATQRAGSEAHRMTWQIDRPVDQIQQAALQRDMKQLRWYGIGLAVYGVLFVVAGVQAISFWLRFLKPSLELAVQHGTADASSISSTFWGLMVYYLVALVFMLVIPMIFVSVNFITRLRRRQRFVYCSSPEYMQSLVDGRADEVTKATMDRISKELMYVNRKCPNCGRWLWTPAEGKVECPSCAQRV